MGLGWVSMKFIVSERVFAGAYRVMQMEPKIRTIAFFPTSKENSLAMAYDYCDFLNDKYVDKNVNKEWGPINRKERIKYHEEQLKLLKSDKRLHWNEHGNRVEG
jgi:hypothetical protein